MKLNSYNLSVTLLAICFLILFTPGIGDLRWYGLLVGTFIGFPWYLLAVKDRVEKKLNTDTATSSRFKVHSPTLFTFGLITAIVGVAIDLAILIKIINEPTTTHFLGGAARLIVGVPFFGIGAYWLFLSLGYKRNET